MNPITMQFVADKYIRLALEEDISSKDMSTDSVVFEYRKDEVRLVYRENDIIAGLQTFERVFILPDPETKVIFGVRNGEEVKEGQHLAIITGDMCILLSGERTALNYLRQLSDIATYTHTVAGMLEGARTRLLDTRKTTPCMRIFEKYTVRIESGQDRHYDLSDGVLLEDNHIDAAGGVREAVVAAEARVPFVCRIEVEAENLDMMKETADIGAGIIMLDGMAPEQMVEVIRYIDDQAGTECFGNMAKENIRTITEPGMNHVSSNALAYSSPILDINLKYLRVLTD